MSVHEVMNQSLTIHEILTRVMVDGIHYGVIPGTEKPTLYQAGAEKICATFRLAPKYDVEDLCDPAENFYRYRVKCSLYTIRDGFFVGSAIGEASSAEEKYQWEKAVCQKHWDTTDPNRRRIKFRRSKDHPDGFEEILQVQRNCADLANTVLKIAVKRSFTSAAKGATAASDLLEVDLDEEPVAELHRQEQKQEPKPKAKAQPAPKLAFGRSKGKAMNDPSVPVEDLQWMLNYIANNVGSEKRKAYEKQDHAMLAALQEEINRRGASRPASQENDVPGTNAGESEGDAIADDVWLDMCATWAKSHPAAYKALKTELGIEHAGKIAPESRVSFRDRMLKK